MSRLSTMPLKDLKRYQIRIEAALSDAEAEMSSYVDRQPVLHFYAACEVARLKNELHRVAGRRLRLTMAENNRRFGLGR